MAITYHVLIDNIDNNQISELNSHLIRLQPKYLNVMGGSRFEQALGYIAQVSSFLPNTRIILRHWPDDGNIKKYNYDMDKWFIETIKPYSWWINKQIAQYNNLIWLLDNESTEDDLTRYAQASARAMDLCAEIGLGLAVGRFATGNPREDQYSQLDTMWEKLKFYNDLHVFSPNEYFDKPDINSGIGSIGRYKHAWNRCQQKYNFTPETVIGEFGLAINYDPHAGWRKSGLGETDYAKLCIEHHDKYYKPDNISACVFSVGNWHGFDVSKTFYDTIEVYKDQWNTPPVIEPKPPVPDKTVYAIAFENGIRIREKPVNGKVIDHCQKHQALQVLENQKNIGVDNQWIKVISRNGQVGYTAAWFYVPCSNPVNGLIKSQILDKKEDNNMSVLRAILDSILNRTILLAVLTPIIAALLANIPDFPFTVDQIAATVVTLILFFTGVVFANSAYDRENVKQGNVWDSDKGQWVKPD